MTGKTISHYRITGQLGSGGMGIVYKAEDTRLGRTVALKFLAAHLLESEEHKQRFLREAKAAASLDHPNICMVHEVGESDGSVFLAMGYVDGPEVRAKIRERPLKLDEALDIAIQAAEGLRAAHQKGVVHRDIKSSNLMLSSTGQVKIMDFGLAQLTGETRITKADTVLGTPAYMSPEQAERIDTDRRTDIWSLGVVLYEMVTGRLPFDGEREAAVVHSIIHEPHEPITAVRTGVPLELDRIVGKALAKNPAQRYQHLDDMLVDLRTLRSSVTGGRVPAARAPSRRRWLWAALLPVVLALGYFAWQAWRAPVSTEPLQAVPLTTLPGVERYPSLSPDGTHVVFTWNGPKQDNHDIYVQLIGAGPPLRITADRRVDYSPTWSPDGRWIAFLRGESTGRVLEGKSELRLIPPLGGPERRLAEIEVWTRPQPTGFLGWCPDSRCLVVADSQGQERRLALFVVSLDTGEKRRLTDPPPPVIGDANPVVSPDGGSLLFERYPTGGGAEIYLLPLGKGLTAGDEPRRLTPAALNAVNPAWMPDSQEFLFSARGGLWRRSISGEGTPARLPFVGEDGAMPVVSRPQPRTPSRLVYVHSYEDMNIWRIEAAAPGAPSSFPPAVAISSTRRDSWGQLSRDGRRVAFVSGRSGEMEIWLAARDGSNAVQLTFLGAPVTGSPNWSPDGQMIVFDSNLEGQSEIYVVPAAGGKPRRLTFHPSNDGGGTFSRDGKWIYFKSDRATGPQVWKMPASGGDAIQVTSNGGWTAAESPDGAYLYYTQTSGPAPSELWRIPTSGGEPVKVLEGVIMRAFTVLDRGIYYIDRPTHETRLNYFDFNTGRSAVVTRGLGDVSLYLTATPDGRTILFSRTDSSVDDLMLVENFR